MFRSRSVREALDRSCRAAPAPAPRKSVPTDVSEREKAPRGKEKSISILLIEDNRLFRMGLSALLQKHEGLKLLASAEQPDHVPKLGRWQHPDVVLLDLGLG